MLAVLVGGAFAAAGVSAWWTVQRAFQEAEVVVPDVAELPVSRAVERLEEVGLELQVEARRPHETIEEGRVFFQDPLAGKSWRRGRVVRVVVSSGAGSITVPNLAGQSTREAVLELRRLGLELGDVVRVHDRRRESGRILAQDPMPGSGATERTPVHVLSSLGPPPRTFVMPDLRGHSIDRVRVALSSVGLQLGSVRERAVSGRPEGIVWAQEPAPGERVGAEQPVDVVVTHQVERAVREPRERPRFFAE